jgi:sec-independent protein translocase protein TatC
MNEAGLKSIEGPPAESKMPLTEHLSELRKRVVVSLSVFIIAFTACFIFSENIFRVLLFPLRGYIQVGYKYPFFEIVIKKASYSLTFLSPTEAFWAHIKISVVTGIMLSVPVILFQLWKFISPGLLEKEKKYVGPFVITGTGLFVLGALFCFLFVLPFAMQFLLTYKTESLVPMITIGNYMDFCLKFILAFGLIFELPVLIVVLTKIGVLTPRWLAKKRKYAILAAFIVAAALTPTPDAFNQIIMAVPIMLLYEVGILFARIFVRPKKKDVPEEENG